MYKVLPCFHSRTFILLTQTLKIPTNIHVRITPGEPAVKIFISIPPENNKKYCIQKFLHIEYKSAGLERKELSSNLSFELEQFTASVFCISQMNQEKTLIVSKETPDNRTLLYKDYFSRFDLYI